MRHPRLRSSGPMHMDENDVRRKKRNGRETSSGRDDRGQSSRVLPVSLCEPPFTSIHIPTHPTKHLIHPRTAHSISFNPFQPPKTTNQSTTNDLLPPPSSHLTPSPQPSMSTSSSDDRASLLAEIASLEASISLLTTPPRPSKRPRLSPPPPSSLSLDASSTLFVLLPDARVSY
jgi:hypothetical protein